MSSSEFHIGGGKVGVECPRIICTDRQRNVALHQFHRPDLRMTSGAPSSREIPMASACS